MKHYALGMDIGGTNTVLGVVDRDGKVVCSDSVKTRDFSVTVTNDANAAAIGEMTNLDSFVMEIYIE